jgi:formate hydrogenlyase subunit 6/NADH:ubiquinone oxidoreductase subunit I
VENLVTMLSDVSRSLLHGPVTQSYPAERHAAPGHLRGLLHLDLSSCTGCGLCTMDCPARAIQVTMLDRKAKRFVMDYHVDRCTFCGQCLQSCNRGSLSMSSNEWELAQLDKAPFLVHFGDPRDVEQALAAATASADKPADHS